MAFLPRVGQFFIGVNVHCYRPSDVYAFEIVGSTKSQPICREVPLLHERAHSALHGDGHGTIRLDVAWLAAHPPPAARAGRVTSRSYSEGCLSYRTRILPADEYSNTPEERVLIVPNSRADYAAGAPVYCSLKTPEQAAAFVHAYSYCSM